MSSLKQDTRTGAELERVNFRHALPRSTGGCARIGILSLWGNVVGEAGATPRRIRQRRWSRRSLADSRGLGGPTRTRAHEAAGTTGEDQAGRNDADKARLES